MPDLETQGISLHYELLGDPAKPPVLLVAGLGGAGRTWGAQVERFAADHFVILPDQRGTGRTTRSAGGYSVQQLATDFADLVDHVVGGPVHVVGSSTGGAIAQLMALDQPQTVRSLTLASSFARPDPYMRREFAVRRTLMAESDIATAYACYALFLFSPDYTRRNPAAVAAWIDRAAAAPAEREVALKRIDMIMAHDALDRLGSVRRPALALCGERDICTPAYHTEEIAGAIEACELVVLPGCGHFVHVEEEERFFEIISGFIARH